MPNADRIKCDLTTLWHPDTRMIGFGLRGQPMEVMLELFNRLYSQSPQDAQARFIMALTLPNPPPGFDALTVDEQVDYAQALWQRIASNPAAVPVPDWHTNVIVARLPEFRNAPEDGKPWGEIHEEIVRKLDNT